MLYMLSIVEMYKALAMLGPCEPRSARGVPGVGGVRSQGGGEGEDIDFAREGVYPPYRLEMQS